MKREPASLGKYETGFYFVAWIIAVFHSIYKVHLISYYFADYDSSYQDFSPGWSWIGGKRDTADIEWVTWIPFMYKLFPWTVAQLVVSQLLKYNHNSTLLPCWYSGISLLFLWNYVGILGMLCMLIQPCLACLLVSIGSKKISCIVHLLSLGVIQLTKTLHVVTQDWLALEDDKYHMLIIGICWMQLRCISCSIDRIDNYGHQNSSNFVKDFLHSTAYCLYLPTLFLGPLILYSEFIDGIEITRKNQWNLKRLMKFCLNLLRYFFWLRFTEFSMHFLHFNALQYHPEIIAQLEPWALYGFGYCMGQYFLNKYVVVYGIWGEFSRADGIKAPPHPKCIGRIHLYSEMWKHFDRGLYNFLIRYIYAPVSETNIPLARMLGSLLSFSFVFLWHGMQMFVFIWSFFNFVALSIEGIAHSVGNSPRYMKFEKKYLNSRNNRRFKCALAAPLLAFSAVSNFYFFAGTEIGHIFLYRLFHDDSSTTGVLMFLLYCCCQVSTEVNNYERRKLYETRRGSIG